MIVKYEKEFLAHTRKREKEGEWDSVAPLKRWHHNISETDHRRPLLSSLDNKHSIKGKIWTWATWIMNAVEIELNCAIVKLNWTLWMRPLRLSAAGKLSHHFCGSDNIQRFAKPNSAWLFRIPLYYPTRLSGESTQCTDWYYRALYFVDALCDNKSFRLIFKDKSIVNRKICWWLRAREEGLRSRRTASLRNPIPVSPVVSELCSLFSCGRGANWWLYESSDALCAIQDSPR